MGLAYPVHSICRACLEPTFSRFVLASSPEVVFIGHWTAYHHYGLLSPISLNIHISTSKWKEALIAKYSFFLKTNNLLFFLPKLCEFTKNTHTKFTDCLFQTRNGRGENQGHCGHWVFTRYALASETSLPDLFYCLQGWCIPHTPSHMIYLGH